MNSLIKSNVIFQFFFVFETLLSDVEAMGEFKLEVLLLIYVLVTTLFWLNIVLLYKYYCFLSCEYI